MVVAFKKLLRHSYLLFADSELPGIILGDVSVFPDVQVVLLGQIHGFLIGVDELSQPSASLLLCQQKSIGDQALTNVIGCVVRFNQGHESLKMEKCVVLKLLLPKVSLPLCRMLLFGVINAFFALGLIILTF